MWNRFFLPPTSSVLYKNAFEFMEVIQSVVKVVQCRILMAFVLGQIEKVVESSETSHCLVVYFVRSGDDSQQHTLELPVLTACPLGQTVNPAVKVPHTDHWLEGS